MLFSDMQKADNQRKQFISHLSTYYLPVCYVANAHGANKKPSVHTWLEEVQLPGVLTHQVKLQGQPQSDEQEHSTQTMAFWGWVMEGNQWHATRQQAPEKKPSNLSNWHLQYILSRFSQTSWKSYTLENDCTMTHKESEKGRGTLNEQIRKFRKISPSPPHPSAWKLEGAWNIASSLPRCQGLSLTMFYLAAWKQRQAWQVAGLPGALPERSQEMAVPLLISTGTTPRIWLIFLCSELVLCNLLVIYN